MITERANQERTEVVGTCYFCGGPREENKTTTLPFVVGERLVIVKDVPAEVCAQCGEAYLTTEVSETVTSAVRELINKNELTVVNFSELVPVSV